MTFTNPVVGGTVLVRPAIESPNFSNDAENGVTGWQIAADGSATFYDVTIGSNDFFIDSDGNAVFKSVSTEELFLNGTSLADSLAALPRGVIAGIDINGGPSAATGAGTGAGVVFARGIIPNFDVTRQYRINWRARVNVVGDPTYLGVACYSKWDGNASQTDTFIFRDQEAGRAPSTAGDYDSGSCVFKLATKTGTDLHFVFYLYAQTAGSTIASDVNNTIVFEDLGAVVDYGTYAIATPTTPPVQTYIKTYTANGSGSYQNDGSNRGVSECYQGYYSSTNGNGFSIITFPYATIQSDLSGATIKKVEVFLTNSHFFANSGGSAIIGTHNQTTASGNHVVSQITDDITRASYAYGQAKWVTVSNTIGTALKANTAKGIALGPGPSTSNVYYGHFAGATQTGKPQLRITYSK